ncbi:MAG: transglutaminase family protein [Acetobacteraceae bacterium]
MLIHAGFDISYFHPNPTAVLLALSLHPSRMPDVIGGPHWISFDPPIPTYDYRDSFGNIITRVLAPAGPLRIQADFTVQDSGLQDAYFPGAMQHQVQDMPEDALIYLLGSRYCDTDRLSDTAWSLFGGTPEGWARVQAICDYVHSRIKFGYAFADRTRTASDAFAGGRGVCRDFAHLAVTFCRCMNIPARYCTGYLGDIGIPPVPDPMDFSAWFEVYLGGAWYTFDARHNRPRIGRIVMARGRDATDVAISTSFGPSTLTGFRVITEEVTGY